MEDITIALGACCISDLCMLSPIQYLRYKAHLELLTITTPTGIESGSSIIELDHGLTLACVADIQTYDFLT